MSKKLKSDSKLDDIELPLLSGENRRNRNSSAAAPHKAKSHFIEFFNPETSPSKFQNDLPVFQFVTFSDVWGLLRRLNTKVGLLGVEDLPLPFPYLNVEQKIVALDAAWTIELAKEKPNIVRAALKAFKKEGLYLAIIFFSFITLKILSLPLVGDIISALTLGNFTESVDRNKMLWKATLLGFAIIILAVLHAWYWHLVCTLASTMKHTVGGFLYKKLHCVTLSSLQTLSIGKVINLLSNDVAELDKGLLNFMPLVFGPYTILLSGAFMWRSFGWSTIFGILCLFGIMILSNYLSNITGGLRAEKSSITDQRIKRTNEIIECIRLIKMYAWEKAFKKAIEALREQEIIKIFKLKQISIIGESFSLTSPQTSIVIMCIISVLSGNMLSPDKIFSCLMILNFVSVWGVNFFHHGIMFVTVVKVLKVRVESLLLLKDIVNHEETSKEYLTQTRNLPLRNDGLSQSPTRKRNTFVEFENYIAWWKKEDSNSKPCLDNINIKLEAGQLTTAIGTIGSGKTSFLMSFLREIPVTEGNLTTKGRIAYVEQEPIIFSGTIQSNILFGLEYDETLYQTVIRACNLHEDLKQFDKGDLTIVGERGITLSGGQKARLSLARALYSQSDIYLLDDPLSAVDSKVAKHIFKYAIRGQLLKDKLVVLVTHHLNYAKESDRVLIFSEGKIIGDGTFEELRKIENSLFNKFKEIEEEEERIQEEKEKSQRESTSKSNVEVKPNDNKAKEKSPAEKPQTKNFSEGASHEISFGTYMKYVRENGDMKFFVFTIAFFLFHGSITIWFSRFLGYWGQQHAEFFYEKEHDQDFGDKTFNNTPYILLSIFMVVFTISGDCFKFFLCSKFILGSNTNIHLKALKSIVRSRILFFDLTPIGQILNRFSNDLGLLDGANANILPLVLDGFIFVGLRMITLVAINPILTVPILVVIYLSFKTKNFLRKPISETKRIDLAIKSPMYSEVSATLGGLLAIRVFRQGGNFIQKYCGMLHANIRAMQAMDRILKFFTLMMSAILDSLTILGTYICIFIVTYTNFDASLFGLALLLFQEVSSYGGYVVRISLTTDINMQSFNRLSNYYNLDPEPPKHIKSQEIALTTSSEYGKWPTKGQISFNNVFMKYRPEFDYVLKGLTFKIDQGAKIGIVGRTGAGKSSIIQVLFRMTDIEDIPGSSIEIDGTNIKSIGLNFLRKNLSIIPQTPVVFTGTIKRNLDPFEEYPDYELWQALEEVNLKNLVESFEKKLETDMTMSSSVFSTGQKQLICLARAILKKSRIIVLDEATANVDIETDDFIQKKIMERFKDCTVLTIAHRLITIANYDKVIVMDNGKVVEYDTPYALLVENEGDQYIRKDQSIFAQMVLNSGEGMAKRIFDIAKSKLNKNIN